MAHNKKKFKGKTPSERIGRLDNHVIGYYRRVSTSLAEECHNEEDKGGFDGKEPHYRPTTTCWLSMQVPGGGPTEMSGRWLIPAAGYYLITGCQPGKMASPKWRRSSSGSERKLHKNIATTYSLTYIHLIFMANNIKKCFWFTIQSVWALLKLKLRPKSSGKPDEKSSHEM